jgi:hypothetical protein
MNNDDAPPDEGKPEASEPSKKPAKPRKAAKTSKAVAKRSSGKPTGKPGDTERDQTQTQETAASGDAPDQSALDDAQTEGPADSATSDESTVEHTTTPLETDQDSEGTKPDVEEAVTATPGERLAAKVREISNAVLVAPSMPDWTAYGACPECGKQIITSGQRFCTQCRNRLTSDGAPRPAGLDANQRRAWGLAAAVVALLVIIAAATSSGSSSPISSSTFPTNPPDTTPVQDTQPSEPPTTAAPTTPAGTQIPESQLAAGDCFAFVGQPNAVNDAQPKTQVDKVPCDGPHPFETVAVLTYPGGLSDAFPGAETVDASASSQCSSRYASYTQGTSLNIISSYTFPSATSWPTGDRTIVCYLHDSSGALLTSPVGGTTTTTTPPAAAQQSTINGDNVNVRTGPGTNYPIITALNAGNQVSISCTTQGENVNGNSQWDQTSINGQTGYVADVYVNSNGASFPSC